MTVLFEPASAIAAGICMTARTINDGRDRRHPRACGWCSFKPHELRAIVDGFNAWAGFDERRGTYERHEARVFQGLSRAEQATLVLAAQAFEPMGAAPADAGHGDRGGGAKSSEPAVQQGPHGSRVRGDSGSNVSANAPADVDDPLPAFLR